MRKKLALGIMFLFLFNLMVPLTALAVNEIPKDFIKKGDSSFFVSGKLGKINSPDDAINFVKSRQKSLGKAADELNFKVKRIKEDDLENTHIKMQQHYKGIPVLGKEVILHADKNGEVYALNGDINDSLNIDINPEISKEEAIEAAKKSVNPPTSNLTDTPHKIQLLNLPEKLKSVNISEKLKNSIEEAQLIIYNFEGEDYLSYEVDLGYSIPEPFSWKVFVDAKTGDIINKYDNLIEFTKATGYGYGFFGDKKNLKLLKENEFYELIEKTDSTSTLDNNVIFTIDYEILPYYPVSNPFYPDSDGVYNQPYQSVGVDAHYYADQVYNYFKTKFGRNSWNGAGAPILVLTYVPVDNAFWAPDLEAFYFGMGDYAPYSSGLDVVAHEYTHAVTDNEVGFIYQNQSGALSESYSDIFASLIDPDWLIGEDVVAPIPGNAIRDMSNPGRFGQPAHMQDYVYLDPLHDNGGVHINSGIPNKAFYNIVSSIGRENAGKIYYQSLMYLTPNASFQDARNAVLFAARDLFGANSAQYNAVAAGWAAVGVYGPYELELDATNISLAQDSPPYTISAFMVNSDGSRQQISSYDITWRTSNASVATVNNGIITPVGKGSAVITATLGQFSAAVTVSVVPSLRELLVDKSVINLTVGSANVAVKATALYSDGTKADVTKLAAWTSSNPDVAGIYAPGVIKGIAKGNTSVNVSYGGKSVEISAIVSMPVKSVTLNKTICDMTTGDELQLASTANYTDGSSEDVSAYTVWTSSNTKVATVSQHGVVTAVGKGKATITGKFGSKTAKATVEVTPPVDRIETDKSAVSLVIGGSKVSLKVTAYYIDGSKAVVTKKATWDLTEGADKVSVKAGVLTGLARGEATLSVGYKDKTIEVPVTVTPKVLSLTSSKASLDLTAGEASEEVTLTARYNDGSEEDVTLKANWKTSKSTVATVERGIITPVGKGTATITGEFNGKRATIKVVVTPPVDRITFDKSELNLVIGKTGKLILKAYYIDNSSATITTNKSVIWTSSNPDVVTVNAGSLKAIGTGDAIITAQYKGETVQSLVRVRPSLTGITGVTNYTFENGQEGAVAEIYAIYSDGTREFVTPSCTFTSSNTKVVNVDSNGLITPVGLGSAKVYVKYGGKSMTISVVVI